jgi:lysophosphatidate acyltransferase
MSWAAYALLALPTSVLALHALSAMVLAPGSSAARHASFFARLLASWMMLVVCACYGVAASVVLRVAGYGGLGQWTTARSFKWTMWLATGVAVDIVRGEQFLDPWYAGEDEKGRRVMGERKARVLVGNHQT